MKTTLSCQIYDFRGEMIYFDCVQSPFFRAEFHTNPGENHIYNFETDRLVTMLVNSRVQLVLEPGDSLHAVIRYGSNGRPVNPEKPDVPLNKNDAFQKVQKRRVQEKR